MAFSTTENTATIGTTEYSFQGGTTSGVPLSNTTECVLQFVFDVSTITIADLFRFRVYEKAASGGTQRVVWEMTTSLAATPTLVSPPLQLKYGWDVTGVKISGTDRSIVGSVRKVTA